MNDYFLWQVEVMTCNFIEQGVNPADIHVLGAESGHRNGRWMMLPKIYGINVHCYPDTRKHKHYPPSVYFYLMRLFLLQYPEMIGQKLFLHDCDMLFTKKINFSFADNHPDFLLSNTNSYICYDYVLSKGEEQINGMADVIGISVDVIKQNNFHSGGAQYIVYGLEPSFYEKVEVDSVRLYDYLCKMEKSFVPRFTGENPIQKWTSGMWSFLWNMWLFGKTTKVDKRLDFCMGTDVYSRITEVPIYHNTGVTATMQDTHFVKSAFINQSPAGVDMVLSDNTSKWYYEQTRKYLG